MGCRRGRRALPGEDAEERGQLAAGEDGTLEELVFERAFAERLAAAAGIAVSADRLVAAGAATATVSNAFGLSAYDACDLDTRVDRLVLSDRVGARMPSRAIYLAAEALAVAPADCVFVDDLQLNVAGASESACTASGTATRVGPSGPSRSSFGLEPQTIDLARRQS